MATLSSKKNGDTQKRGEEDKYRHKKRLPPPKACMQPSLTGGITSLSPIESNNWEFSSTRAQTIEQMKQELCFGTEMQWIRCGSNLGEASKKIEVIESGPEWRCIVKIVISTPPQADVERDKNRYFSTALKKEGRKRIWNRKLDVSEQLLWCFSQNHQNTRLSRAVDHCLFGSVSLPWATAFPV